LSSGFEKKARQFVSGRRGAYSKKAIAEINRQGLNQTKHVPARKKGDGGSDSGTGHLAQIQEPGPARIETTDTSSLENVVVHLLLSGRDPRSQKCPSYLKDQTASAANMWDPIAKAVRKSSISINTNL